MVLSAAELSALLAGAAILLIAMGLSQVTTQAAMDSRLRTFVRRESTPIPVSLLRAHEERHPAIVERMNRRLRQASLAKRLQADLIRAGIDLPASRFLLLQGAAAASTLWLVSLFLSAKLGDPMFGLGLGVAAGIAVWMAPKLALSFMVGRRLKKFENQLPTAIDAMAGALQAGSSLIQAMEMVGREMPAPIGEELAIVVREMSVGVPMADAFTGMLDRIESLDLDMLVTAISIQHRVGGNLSQILRSISHTIRERLRIKGEIGVLTAQQRLSAIIVSGLPLLIIGALFVLAPSYISKLFEPGIARMLLIVGGLGIVAGFYCLRKIADIDV
jgi:tight adherence protein B